MGTKHGNSDRLTHTITLILAIASLGLQLISHESRVLCVIQNVDQLGTHVDSVE